MSSAVKESLPIRSAACILGAAAATLLHISIVALGNVTVGWGFDLVLAGIHFLAAIAFAFLFAGILRERRLRALMSISSLIAVAASAGYFLALRSLGRLPPFVEWGSFVLTSLGLGFFSASVAKMLILRNTANER